MSDSVASKFFHSKDTSLHLGVASALRPSARTRPRRAPPERASRRGARRSSLEEQDERWLCYVGVLEPCSFTHGCSGVLNHECSLGCAPVVYKRGGGCAGCILGRHAGGAGRSTVRGGR